MGSILWKIYDDWNKEINDFILPIYVRKLDTKLIESSFCLVLDRVLSFYPFTQFIFTKYLIQSSLKVLTST